jgi:hypothetical protein
MDLTFPLPARGSVDLTATRTVTLRWHKHASGVVLDITCEEGVVHHQVVTDDNPDVGVGAQEGGAQPHELPGPTWVMCAGLPLSQHRDLFVRATNTVHLGVGLGGPQEVWAEAERQVRAARARAVMRTAWAVVRDLAVHAASVCDPCARAVALGFTPHARHWVYRQVVRDPTGHLAQVARTCPGALIFALGLLEHPSCHGAGHTLLADLRQGRRLDVAIDGAVEAWTHAREVEDTPWSFGYAFRRVREGGLADVTRVKRQQRLLVRRAGRHAPTTLLWLPPPLVVTPEDVPAATVANARWFRAVKAVPSFLHDGLERIPPTVARGLLSLVALHPDVVEKGGQPRWRAQQRTRNMLDYLVHERRVVTRHNDPAALAAACRRWHRAVRESGNVGPCVELPRLLDTPRVFGDAVITPILTSDALAEEGRRMSHCVATRLRTAQEGRCFLFQVRVGAELLTLEVCAQGGALYPGDFRGTANRSPTLREAAAVQPFLEEVCGQTVAGRGAA